MTHVRTQIREKAKEFLTGLASTSDRVFLTRLFPFGDIELPAWTIRNGDEESENITMAGDLQRQFILTLHGFASVTEDIDEVLDTMAVEAEAAIERTFDGLAKESALTATEFEISGEGETEVGSVQLEYTVLYFTSRNDPETPK